MKNHTLTHIHLVATDRFPIRIIPDIPPEATLWLNPETNKLQYSVLELQSSKAKHQHLYLTNDEDIKEGDWCILTMPDTYPPSVVRIVKKFEDANTLQEYHYLGKERGDTWTRYGREFRKIIATTNKELWTKLSANEEQLLKAEKGELHPTDVDLKYSKGIAKIPQDLIELYIKSYNQGKPLEKVWLEQETQDVSVKEYNSQQYRLKLNQQGEVIWNLGKERIYTREEMKQSVIDAVKKFSYFDGVIAIKLDKWFDKNYPQ